MSEQGVDFVAASFVRKASDVVAIREHLQNVGGEKIKIISKVLTISPDRTATPVRVPYTHLNCVYPVTFTSIFLLLLQTFIPAFTC